MAERETVVAGKLVGRGTALTHHQGRTWFVSGALPGEQVRVEVMRRRAGVTEARVVELLADPHEARLHSPCPHAPTCGGCDWPHVEAEAGALLKSGMAAEAARGQAVASRALAAAAAQPSPLEYRLRSRLHWDPATRTLGFFTSRSHQVVAIESCRVVSPRLRASLGILGDALAAANTPAAEVEWLEDLHGTTAIAGLRPARGGRTLPPSTIPSEAAAGEVVNGFHALDGTGRCTTGWGAEAVTMQLPTPLSVPVGAFFQVNRHLVPWLYRRVGEICAESNDPIWDLHAGVGFLAAAAQASGPRDTVLVEPFKVAARAAQSNLDHAHVEAGVTAGAYLRRCESLPRGALVLTDPPRSGMTGDQRRGLAAWHPARILMMACDPATWARDTSFLLDNGYSLRHTEVVDLFPSTHHVEILALLESS